MKSSSELRQLLKELNEIYEIVEDYVMLIEDANYRPQCIGIKGWGAGNTFSAFFEVEEGLEQEIPFRLFDDYAGLMKEAQEEKEKRDKIFQENSRDARRLQYEKLKQEFEGE